MQFRTTAGNASADGNGCKAAGHYSALACAAAAANEHAQVLALPVKQLEHAVFFEQHAADLALGQLLNTKNGWNRTLHSRTETNLLLLRAQPRFVHARLVRKLGICAVLQRSFATDRTGG